MFDWKPDEHTQITQLGIESLCMYMINQTQMDPGTLYTIFLKNSREQVHIIPPNFPIKLLSFFLFPLWDG